MTDPKPYPENLPPETAFRHLPAVQRSSVPGIGYADVELSRYAAVEDFHLRAIWRIFRKRKWLILGIACVVTTLVTVESFRNKPLYQATATIEIGRGSATRVSSREIVFQEEDALYIAMNTSEVILKSTPLLEDVVEQLRLDQNPAFVDTSKTTVLESLNQIAGKIQRPAGTPSPARFTATPLTGKINGNRTAEEVERLAPFVGMLEASLLVKPIDDTRAMTIAFTHTDAGLAARVTNTIAERFVQTSFEKKLAGFTNASEWLDRSTRELKSRVEKSETALVDYMKKSNIYSTEGKETLITEKLSKLHDLATRVETDRILKDSLYEQVREGRIAQIPEAFADAHTVELQHRLGELETTAAELSVTYGPKYWKMTEIQQQMMEIRAQIAEGLTRLADKLRADHERIVRDENSLKAALIDAKAGAVQENQHAIQYSILRQDVETAKAMYTEFLQKTSQANLEVAQQHSNIRVISPARIPKVPIGPNRRQAVTLALLLSLVGGLGLAWLVERFDDSIRNVDDVSRATQLPALAVIPAITESRFLNGRKRKALSGQPLVVSPDRKLPEHIRRARLMEFEGRSPASEAYRALRTGLLLSAVGNPPKTILVTSVRAADGKSTTATNVAISLAQLGASVVLVDCDLRKPTLHDVFSTSRASGLSTYLVRNVEVDEVIQKLPAENLYMIPGGPCPPNPAELLSSQRMKTLLTQLAERFDHIVVDSPPLGSVTDPVILSTMVDGTILVVDGGRNSRQAVQRACRELATVGGRIFGIVLNKVDLRREGHDDYYYYAYQYSDSDNERHAGA